MMAKAEARAGRVDAAVLDLAEAVLLAGREGEVFDAVVVDEDRRGTIIQIVDPAALARVDAHRVDPGDEVRVRLAPRRPGRPGTSSCTEWADRARCVLEGSAPSVAPKKL